MINYQRRSRKINSLEEFSSKFEIWDGTTQKSNIKKYWSSIEHRILVKNSEGIQKKNKMYLETLFSNCECENVCYIKWYECYSLHVSVLWKRKSIFMLCNYIICLFCIHPNWQWLIFPFKISSKIIRVLTYDIKNKSNVHT